MRVNIFSFFRKIFFSVTGKILVLAAGIACFTSLIVGGLYYFQTVHIALEKETDRLAAHAHLMAPQFRASFSELKSDVLFISQLPPIQGLVRSIRNGDVDPLDGSTTELWRTRLEAIFKAMMGPKKNYVQIRYIGVADGGRELVRVNRTAAGIDAVESPDLQRKGEESYYKAGIGLPPESVYFAAVSLNKERGKIQKPYMPVIRALMPVYDGEGKIFGLIVISAAYDRFLQDTVNNLQTQEDLYIINDLGDYIASEPGKGVTAFKFSDVQESTPEKISVIDALQNEQKSEGTLFKAIGGKDMVIYYFRFFFDDSNRERFLNLALATPKDTLLEEAYDTKLYSLILVLGLLIMTSILAAFVSRFLTDPLNQMINEMRKYARGKKNLLLPVGARDEIGEMARVFQDLTKNLDESREAERRSFGRLQSILDNTVDGLITIDERGTVKSYNNACRKIFGYEPEEVIGRNIKMLMPSEYADHHDQYLENYCRTGEAKIIGIGREIKAQRKDGIIFPADLSVAEIPQEDGGRIFSGMVRDITERKKAEEDLVASNLELERFAYVASHDLQEPLRMVSSFTKLLHEHYENDMNEEAEKYMNIIVESAGRMQALISDLLEYSRLGTEAAGFREVDCNEIMRIVEENLSENIKETEARLTVDKLPNIHVNPVRFARLLQNLVGNAIKYQDKTRVPEIHVKAEEQGSQWVFSVSDNGIGMKREYLQQIFIIFKRLHSKSEYPGTGIGLAVCKKIAESLGGRIWVDSEPGKGSTFYFTVSKQKKKEELNERSQAA